jgi:hypothetical protein
VDLSRFSGTYPTSLSDLAIIRFLRMLAAWRGNFSFMSLPRCRQTKLNHRRGVGRKIGRGVLEHCVGILRASRKRSAAYVRFE